VDTADTLSAGRPRLRSLLEVRALAYVFRGFFEDFLVFGFSAMGDIREYIRIPRGKSGGRGMFANSYG
jgi:hypothetical protein